MKLKFGFLLLSIWIFVTLQSCTSNNFELKSIDAKKIAEFDVLNDSIFLGKVVDIDVYKGRFFLLDRSATHVYELNEKLELVKVHLTKGDGPEDVGDLLKIDLYDNKIYLMDQNSSSLKSFDFDGKIDLNHKISNQFTSDFVIGSGHIFYGDFRERNPISRVKLKDKSSIGFGKRRTWPNKDFEVERHLEITPDNQIISALDQDKPILDLYEFNGKLVTSLDLSSLDLFKYTHEKYERDVVVRRNSGLIFIQDISLYQNKLYLLVSSFSPELVNSYNQIVECIISDNKIVPTRIIKLAPDAYYLSFSVYNKGRNFIGFDVASNSIEIFEIAQ